MKKAELNVYPTGLMREQPCKHFHFFYNLEKLILKSVKITLFEYQILFIRNITIRKGKCQDTVYI